jgi:exonuclease VII small subunit
MNTSNKQVDSTAELILKTERSMQRAVQKLYEERAKLNESVSIWRDGKIVTLPAAELLKESEQTTVQN